MIQLTHEAAAEVLFATGQIPADPVAAAKLVARCCRRDPLAVQHAVAVLAAEYGEHPTEAAARMRRCLAVAPGRVEIEDSAPALPAACESDGCGNGAPLELVGRDLLCLPCAARALLEESAGPDDEMEDGRVEY